MDAWCDIGYHHRGAEKMGERQSWHTYIPYTDRVDYLGGVMNNFPYVLAVEKLAGIDVPDRAKVIRIMLAELFRITQPPGLLRHVRPGPRRDDPVFYMFTDRERVLDIIEAITGARMHPGWFRIGGVAQDLPDGWEQMVRDLLAYLPKRLRRVRPHGDEEPHLPRADARRRRAGPPTTAVAWGATGPVLRATGMDWDFRKKRPYGGYDQFEFDVPTGTRGDCYDRAVVHVEEMRQSLRIIQQCVDHMPAGRLQEPPSAWPPRRCKSGRCTTSRR